MGQPRELETREWVSEEVLVMAEDAMVHSLQMLVKSQSR